MRTSELENFRTREPSLRILFLILFFPLMTVAQSLQHRFELMAPKPTYKDIVYINTLQDGRVIAGLYPNGLLFSSDQGLNWNEVNYPNVEGAILKIVQFSPDSFYGITTKSEFIKTTDGGGSFSVYVLQNMDPSVSIVDISFPDPQNGFVTLYDSPRDAWVTTNAGQTWKRIYLPNDFWGRSILMTGNSVLYASASERIIRSSDLGNTWNTVLYSRSGQFFEHGSNKISFFSSNDTVYTSLDRGVTWNYTSVTPYKFETNFISKMPEGTVFVPREYFSALYKSTDGLLTWSRAAWLGSSEYRNALTMVSDTVGILAGKRGSILRHSGAQYTPTLITRNQFRQSKAFFTDSLWGINTFGLYTSNGGETWQGNTTNPYNYVDWGSYLTVSPGGFGMIGFNWRYQIIPDPNFTVYSDINVTTDRGRSWVKKEVKKYFYTTAVTSFGDSVIVAVLKKEQGTGENYEARVIQWTNTGVTVRTVPLSMGILSLAAIKSRNMVLGTIGNSILVSYDTARTWQTLFSSGSNYKLTDVKAFESGLIVGCGETSNYYSTDYGVTWSPGYPANYWQGVFAVSPTGLLACSSSSRVKIGHRNWPTYQILDYDLITQIWNLQFVDKNTLMVQNNRGDYFKYRIMDTASVVSINQTASLPGEFTLSQNYPNPFNPETVSRYALPVAGFAKGVVYDILGREVATLLNAEMPAGEHQLKFDAAQLPSGVYIFRLEAGEYSSAIKMIINK